MSSDDEVIYRRRKGTKRVILSSDEEDDDDDTPLVIRLPRRKTKKERNKRAKSPTKKRRQTKGGKQQQESKEPIVHVDITSKPQQHVEVKNSVVKQHQQWIASFPPSELCLYIGQRGYNPEVVQGLWKTFLRYAREKVDPDFTDVTKEQLLQLFKIADTIYFNGVLTQLALKEKREIRAEFLKCTKIGGLYAQPYCFVTNQKLHEISMNKEILLKIPIGESRVSNGILCSSRLECLLNVLVHEMIHMLMEMTCPYFKAMIFQTKKKQKNIHGKEFKAIALNLFGHTKANHRLHHTLKEEHYHRFAPPSKAKKSKKWATTMVKQFEAWRDGGASAAGSAAGSASIPTQQPKKFKPKSIDDVHIGDEVGINLEDADGVYSFIVKAKTAGGYVILHGQRMFLETDGQVEELTPEDEMIHWKQIVFIKR
jgi:hypothetical protein